MSDNVQAAGDGLPARLARDLYVHTVFRHNAPAPQLRAPQLTDTERPSDMQQAEMFSSGLTADAPLRSESDLAATCLRLIEGRAQLSATEAALAAQARGGLVLQSQLGSLRESIQRGADPLGDAFLSLRSARLRRDAGAVYTPPGIVNAMLAWVGERATPTRVVDPGAGSGRFVFAAARRFPRAELLAVEADPLAALMLRANADVLGLGARLQLHVGDYRELEPKSHPGPTAFVGNPPYVRHHEIAPSWKAWYRAQCARHGIRASALAGLHLHFFVQTLRLARPGDIGAFITAAEWLDVNYGAALRALLLDHLGGIDLRVLEPTVEAFPGTATTAAITGFCIGETAAPVRVQALDHARDFDTPGAGFDISRDELRAHARWSVLVRRHCPVTAGTIELGELFRVHRGQVTGGNEIWVARDNAMGLPERLRLAAVTKARDLIDAGEQLACLAGLRRVIELPLDLDELAVDERETVQRFLRWARSRGAHESYVARHRKAWWAVGLRQAAPILCTYMGRRPPQFTLNACGARHINIAHGLYPRSGLEPDVLRRIANWLNRNIDVREGRTYAGGLTKFEPREVERLRLPDPMSLPG